jgi:hypothetical protein
VDKQFQESKNERLWFKTNRKLGKLYFDLHQFDTLRAILKQLRTSCQVFFLLNSIYFALSGFFRRKRAKSIKEEHPAVGNFHPRNPDVHRSEEQQGSAATVS